MLARRPTSRAGRWFAQRALNMTDRPRNKRIAVLFIVPSLTRAGAETQVVNLANGLDPEAFETHLLSFEQDVSQLERVDRDRVRFHHPRRTRRWIDTDLVRQIARVIEEEEIDIVHCSLQFSVLWAWLARLRTPRRPRIVAAIHTTINVDLKSELQDRVLYQWILRRCEGIIFVCQSQQTHWQSKFPFLVGRSDVIYNGVDTDRFSPEAVPGQGTRLRATLEIPPHAILLCSIARFAPEKGQHLLVEACARARRHDLYLAFAGEGELQGAIVAQVRASGLEARTRFLGNLPDVRPLLAAADLLVLPSTAVETFSMAMLEALAMQTPVLASDIGGMAEAVIEGQTGALVRPGDAAGLTRRIDALTADPSGLAALGTHGRALVVARFSEGRMIDETAAMLERVFRLGRNPER
jgi:glycosyltransferase involved in cell wall biosynthesis